MVDAYNNPIDTFISNIMGTWNLLETIRIISPETKVIVSTSDKAYGVPEEIPTNENISYMVFFHMSFQKAPRIYCLKHTQQLMV